MRETFIPIQQEMPGFNPFFGSWVCQDETQSILVDPGPANTGKRLLDSLERAGIDRLDYVLLTHIHIDHAGALRDVLDRYPDAKAVCHEKGIPHVVDPQKLYRGSLNVLGEIAGCYGPPGPVPKDRLIPHTACSVEGLKIIETPGHAVHHLSFEYQGRLYAGEAAGNYFSIEGLEYLRPATPPRFFLDVFINSVDRLLALDNQPIRYAHVESAQESHGLISKFRDQLRFWESLIGDAFDRSGPREEIIQGCVERLLKEDPGLEAFRLMDEATRKRERIFMTNSVNGFLGFFEEKASRS